MRCHLQQEGGICAHLNNILRITRTVLVSWCPFSTLAAAKAASSDAIVPMTAAELGHHHQRMQLPCERVCFLYITRLGIVNNINRHVGCGMLLPRSAEKETGTSSEH